MIKAVLADIDNTFIDFPAGASMVVEETFRRAGLGFSDEVLEVYNSVSKDVWGRLDRGELSHGDIVYGRWDMIFDRLGIRYSSEKMEDIFETLLSETAVPGKAPRSARLPSPENTRCTLQATVSPRTRDAA